MSSAFPQIFSLIKYHWIYTWLTICFVIYPPCNLIAYLANCFTLESTLLYHWVIWYNTYNGDLTTWLTKWGLCHMIQLWLNFSHHITYHIYLTINSSHGCYCRLLLSYDPSLDSSHAFHAMNYIEYFSLQYYINQHQLSLMLATLRICHRMIRFYKYVLCSWCSDWFDIYQTCNTGSLFTDRTCSRYKMPIEYPSNCFIAWFYSSLLV